MLFLVLCISNNLVFLFRRIELMTYATKKAIIMITRKQNATMIRSNSPLLSLALVAVVVGSKEGQLILITLSKMFRSSSG